MSQPTPGSGNREMRPMIWDGTLDDGQQQVVTLTYEIGSHTRVWDVSSDESDWARIITFWDAAVDTAWWMPEVDDEVLVAFEHGDTRFPYIVGTVYNDKDRPPAFGSGVVTEVGAEDVLGLDNYTVSLFSEPDTNPDLPPLYYITVRYNASRTGKAEYRYAVNESVEKIRIENGTVLHRTFEISTYRITEEQGVDMKEFLFADTLHLIYVG